MRVGFVWALGMAVALAGCVRTELLDRPTDGGHLQVLPQQPARGTGGGAGGSSGSGGTSGSGGSSGSTAGCGAGRTQCGGVCTDLRSDPAHCGACETSCPTGQFCIQGACAAGCPVATDTVCDGRCVDLGLAWDNCGACGRRCAGGEGCVAGACGPLPCRSILLDTPWGRLAPGARPVGLAAGDLDGDGWLDLVAADAANTSVTVYLSGQGVPFGTGRSYLAGVVPNSVVVADFDNDGRPDVAVGGDIQAGAAVLYNQGGGTLGAPQSVQTGAVVTRLAAFDATGDGLADLVAGTAQGIYVAGAVPGGGFTTPRLTPMFTGVGDMASGDLVPDGRLDLVVATVNALGIMYGLPGGGFSPYFPIVGTTPGRPAVADFTGDGIPDVITSTLAIYRGDGQGGLSLWSQGAAPFGGVSLITAGDVNRDGRPDVVVTSGEPALHVYLNTGIGLAPPERYAVEANPAALLLLDRTGDGAPELAVLDALSARLLVNRGDGTFFPGSPDGTLRLGQGYRVGALLVPDGQPDIGVWSPPGSIQFGSLDADGGVSALGGWGYSFEAIGISAQETDEFAGVSSGELMVCPVEPVRACASAWAPDADSPIALGDLDGDGRGDVVAFEHFAPVALLYLQDADGGLSPQAPLPIGGVPGAVSLADLDGDGRLDLALGLDSALEVRLNHGPAGWGAPHQVPLPSGTVALAAGDLDTDGHLDLVAGSSSGEVTVLLNAGDGLTFATAAVTCPGGTGPLALGDLDGDGRLDVAASAGVQACLWLNDGAGRLGARHVLPLPAEALDLAAADFDGDGRADLAFAYRFERAGILRGTCSPW